VHVPDSPPGTQEAPALQQSPKSLRVLLASSNQGKLREYRRMAEGLRIELDLLSGFSGFPPFDESAPTFAENSAGKALHYSQFTTEIVLADDSGLVVPALRGAPGVHSARYAGPNATDADRTQKLLHEMQGIEGEERRARFVCVTSLARAGRVLAVTSAFSGGLVALEPHGQQGFGYDPIFFSPELGRTFAEASEDEKNRLSHRGKAFHKVLEYLEASKFL
jgi:XTP/dITP diphosphohydrolase